MSSSVRQRHAKRLIRDRNEVTQDTSRLCTDAKTRSTVPRRQRSAKLVSSSSCTVYSVMLEQCRSLASTLRTAASRIVKACSLWCDVRRADEVALLSAAMKEIKLCFGHGFGGRLCSARACLLDPGGSTVTYPSQEGSRNACMEKEKGIIFECMNKRKTIVVKTADVAEQMGIHVKSQTLPLPLVCTPLRADIGHPLGVLTVENLCPNAKGLDAGISMANLSRTNHPACDDVSTCEDYHDRLIPFVKKNDEACKGVKLWKVKDESGCASRVICGHVRKISRSKGYSWTYTIQWEDGCRDSEISFRAIKELLKSTPRSLGVGVPCDATVIGFVEYAARAIGVHMIRLRSIVHIRRIIVIPRSPSNTVVDLYRLGLESSLRFILRARLAEIWEVETDRLIHIVAQMETDFSFHQMRVTRRLLEVPGHKRHIFWSQVDAQEIFTMPHTRDILVAPFGNCSSQGALLVVTITGGSSDLKNNLFLKEMSAALTRVKECMTRRQKRACARAHTLESIRLLCSDSRLHADEVEAGVLSAIARCLPASHASVGLTYDNGGSIVLMGHHEQREDGSPLFGCLPPALSDGVIVRGTFEDREKKFQTGTSVQVRHGNALYGARIAANRGHRHFDVKYCTRDWMGRFEQEAGVPVSRIRHVQLPQTKILPECLINAKNWPILLEPLSSARGILCIEAWSHMNPEPRHDEVHIKNFLKETAKYLGGVIDDKIRGSSLRLLRSSTDQERLLSVTEIIDTFFFQKKLCGTYMDHTKLCDLQSLEGTRMVHDMLHRCSGMLSGVVAGTAALLVQASVPYTACLSLLEDLDLRVFCSSKYSVISWEHMAFNCKVCKIAALSSPGVERAETGDIMLEGHVKAMQAICEESCSLATAIHDVTSEISELMGSVGMYICYVFSRGCACIELFSERQMEVSPDRWEVSERMIFKCACTGQPVCKRDSKSNGETTLCLPMTASAETQVVLLVKDHGLKHEDNPSIMSRKWLNLLEAVAVILGDTMDAYSRNCELSLLKTFYQGTSLSHQQISTRDIYCSGLAAIHRQLIYIARLSIWQLQRPSACTLMLSLTVLEARGARSSKPIVALIYFNDIEIGRTYACPLTADAHAAFEHRQFTVMLKKCWISSLLRIELWHTKKSQICLESNSFWNFANLMGLLELRGSYLHLPAGTLSYPLCDVYRRPLSNSIYLSAFLKIKSSSLCQVCSIEDYNFTKSNTTKVADDIETVVLVMVSIANLPLILGQYMCVFLDEHGSELGRTPPAPYKCSLEWQNLTIRISLNSSCFCCLMRAELVLIGQIPRTLATADLSAACLVHLPRNVIQLKIRMRGLASQYLLEEKREGDLLPECPVLGLRFEKLPPNRLVSSLRLRRPKDTSPSVVSLSRVAHGMVDFSQATVDAGGKFLAIATAACERGAPCHSSDLLIVPFDDVWRNIENFSIRPFGRTNFAVTVATGTGVIAEGTLGYVCEATNAMEAALRCHRLKSLHEVFKVHVSREISSMCDNWMLCPIPKVIDNILNSLACCLPGCGVYVSLLQPGTNELVCVASNSLSCMCGKVLRRSYGGHKPYKTRSLLPYACVPLAHNESACGVLTLDMFNYVVGAHKTQPTRLESCMLHLLRHVGANLARAVDSRRKSDALALLQRPAKLKQRYALAMDAICCNISCVSQCKVLQIDDERQFTFLMDRKSATSSADPELCSTPVSLSQMAMGKLSDTVLQRMQRDTSKLISLGTERVIVLLGQLSVVHILVISLIEQADIAQPAAAYISAVARCMGGPWPATIKG